MGLAAGFATNRGLVRQTNEDSFLVRKGLYVVCDGMGGARGGEVASQMACESMVAIDPATAGKDELRAAIVDANESHRRPQSRRAPSSGHGHHSDVRPHPRRHHDSRPRGRFAGLPPARGDAPPAHRRPFLGGRDGAPRRDHGRPKPRSTPIAASSPRRWAPRARPSPTSWRCRSEPGDRLLLCSDGLSGMVSDETIQELLRQPDGPQAVADALVEAALKGGGEDNVTVVVVETLVPDERAGDGAGRAGAAAGGDRRAARRGRGHPGAHRPGSRSGAPSRASCAPLWAWAPS